MARMVVMGVAVSDPLCMQYNVTSFRNGEYGIFHRRSGDIHWMYPHIVENGGHGIFWKELDDVANTNNSFIQHGLLVGSVDPNRRVGVAGVFAPQNEFWIGTND